MFVKILGNNSKKRGPTGKNKQLGDPQLRASPPLESHCPDSHLLLSSVTLNRSTHLFESQLWQL